MATTVGQHSVAAFTSPVNGTTPIDANTVRGNDNTVRVAYVDHDADPGIHVQSSTIASRPTAGTAGRKWITEDSGVYTLWFDDGTNWHPVSSENVALTVLAGENLVKGDVVKVTGWNNGQDLPEVVKTTSASDTAFAVITAAVSSGSMGYATNTGIVQDVNTAAYSVGTILYANGSGGFTSTKPTSGNYQPCAYVLRSNTNNGVYYVEFSSPRIVESSANTASTIVQRDASGNFSAGTITAGALTSTGLVTFASLKGTGATTVTDILNDSTMATASATTLATSASIKTYVDNKVATVDTLAEVLANGNTTGANDIIVNAGQKIRTPLVAAQDGTSAITIANTTGALTLNTALADSNLATISTAGKVSNSATTATSANTASAIVARDASGNFTAGTITATLSGAAPAGSLSGTTLASNVVSSSLTSLGTLTSLTVNGDITASTNQLKLVASTGNLGIGTATPAYKLDVAGSANVSTGNTYKVNGTDVLSATTLGSGVTASSLTSVGTLTSLTVSGDLTVDTNTLSVNATSNRVGIGTTSAVWNSAEKLVVSQSVDAPVITGYSTFGAGTPVLVSWNSATSGTREHIWFADSASGGVRGKIATNGANGLQFLYGSTVGMSLDSSGRVGVGTASPSGIFDVRGSGTSGDNNTFVRWAADSAGFAPGFNLHKARGTITSPTVVSSGDQLGVVLFAGYDGTSYQNAAYIESRVDGTPGSGDMPGRLGFYTTADGSATPTERMRLDASGNLGLGVTPSAWTANTKALQIKNAAIWNDDWNLKTTVGYNTFQDGNGSYKYIGSFAATRYDISTSGHSWYYAASGTAGNAITFTQAMTLDASGNLGVGTTNPNGSRLVVQSNSSTIAGNRNVLHLRNSNSSGNQSNWFVFGSAGEEVSAYIGNDQGAGGTERNVLSFGTGSTERMRLDSSGNLLVGPTSNVGSGRRELAMTGSNGAVVSLGNSTSADQLQIASDSGANALINNKANTPMIFYTNNTERARITSGGFFQVKTDASSEANITSKYTSVGTSATAICSRNTDVGQLVIVYGVDASYNIFTDLVFSATTAGPTVISAKTVSGGPAGRTYTMADAQLKLAMASGTYNIYTAQFSI